jgi:hypothetical protein
LERSYPVTFASIFVGYLHWDFCWLLWHQRSSPDLGSIVHHVLFIGITHYVLWGWYFKRPYAWLSLAELSTVFLNMRWFLAVSDAKETVAYYITSLCFAVSFLATRVLGYFLGVWDIWHKWSLWKDAQWGLYVVVAGCHAGLLLNLFWSRMVVKAVARAIRKEAKSA